VTTIKLKKVTIPAAALVVNAFKIGRFIATFLVI
jgi:hypothetical protein